VRAFRRPCPSSHGKYRPEFSPARLRDIPAISSTHRGDGQRVHTSRIRGSVRGPFQRGRVGNGAVFLVGAGRCVRSLLRRTTQVDRLTPLVHTLVRPTHTRTYTTSRVHGAIYTYTPAVPRTRQMWTRVCTAHTYKHESARADLQLRSRESHGNEPRPLMNESNDPTVRDSARQPLDYTPVRSVGIA